MSTTYTITNTHHETSAYERRQYLSSSRAPQNTRSFSPSPSSSSKTASLSSSTMMTARAGPSAHHQQQVASSSSSSWSPLLTSTMTITASPKPFNSRRAIYVNDEYDDNDDDDDMYASLGESGDDDDLSVSTLDDTGSEAEEDEDQSRLHRWSIHDSLFSPLPSQGDYLFSSFSPSFLFRSSSSVFPSFTFFVGRHRHWWCMPVFLSFLLLLRGRSLGS